MRPLPLSTTIAASRQVLRRHRSLSTFLFSVVLGLLPLAAHAAGSLGVVSVAIKADVTFGNMDCESILQLDISGFDGSRSAVAHHCDEQETEYYWDTETNLMRVRLIPGKTYTLSVNASGTSSFTLHANPEAGYTLEIEGEPSQQETGDDTTTSFKLRIRPAAESGAGIRGGAATSLGNDRTLWQLALGSLSNGQSAGALAFVDIDEAPGAMFSAALLEYQSPSVSEVDVRRVSGVVRQVIAPQVCVDVVQTTSTRVDLKVYHRAQLGSESGGLFSFNGDPFAAYAIDRESGDIATIVITRELRDLSETTYTGSVVRTDLTRLNRASGTWTATDWRQQGQTALTERVRTLGGSTETFTVAAPGQSGSPTTKLERTLTTKAWGQEVDQETLGTSNSVTTTYGYWDAVSEDSFLYSLVRSRTTTGGRWEAYEYYDTDAQAGQIQRRHGPFNNSDTSVPANLSSHDGTVTEYAYASDALGRPTRPTLIETKVAGTTVAKTEIAYGTAEQLIANKAYLKFVPATRHDYSDASGYLTTITKTFAEDAGYHDGAESDFFFRNRVHSVQQPTGAKQVFLYQRGTWNGSSFTISDNHGLDVPSSGSASRVSVISGSATSGTAYSDPDGYPVDSLYLVNNKSTKQVTIRDAYARVVRTESYIYGDNAWRFVSAVNYQWNLANQLVKRATNESTSYDLTNGAIYEATCSGEFLTGETDETGIAVTNTHDVAGRLETTTQASGGGIGALTTRFVYDPAGHVTQKTVGYGLGETLVSSASYDDAGRVTSESLPGPNGALTTSYAYSPGSRQVTVTLPNGGTRIETAQADGSVANITGTGVVSEYYTYGIVSGERYGRVNIGGSSSLRQRESWSDWLGRATKTSRPGFDTQPAYVEEAFFDATTGLPSRTEVKDGNNAALLAPTRYEYDLLGNLTRSGQDVGANGALDLASADRIADQDQQFKSYDNQWWLEQVTKTYPTASSDTALETSTTRIRLTGLTSSLRAETKTTDMDGNVIDQTVTVNRANQTVTTATTMTGHANTRTEVVTNGALTSTTGFDGLEYTTGYDALHRPSTATAPRIGTTTTSYKSGSTFVWRVQDPAGNYVLTYAYDNAGRVIQATDAGSKSQRFEYNTRNQVVHQWGEAGYPAAYVYDDYGQQTQLHTFQTGTWTGSTWPGGTPTSVTQWAYDEASGLLSAKTDAASHSVTYTYNARGQTLVRTWARGVTTTYGYDSNTGELLSQDYSDSTPDVTYTYTRAGQLNTVADVTGTRDFVYDGTMPLRLDAVALDTFYAGRILTRQYDGIKRPGGFLLGVTGSPSGDLTQTYTYNTLGRFDHLESVSSAQGSRTFNYEYNSGGLVSSLGVATSAFTASRSYEEHRNLLTSIHTQWSTTSRARYDYTYNALGQRETTKQSGDVFGDFGGSTYYRHAYNDRGELTDSTDYLGEDPGSTSSPQLSGRHFAFGYDQIGNRTSASRTGTAGSPDTYTANALNQYSNRTNNYAHVAGTAQTASSIGVTGGTTTSQIGRQGRYWDAQTTLANEDHPAKADLTITATLAGSPALVRTETRTAYLAKALQAFTYDNDGNLTSDGVWDYAYDAENRLIQMTTTSVAVTAGFPDRLLEFKYDYLGRRVQKRSLDATASTETWRRYLYDGDNLVAEFNAPSGTSCGSVLRSYTWGLDLAGSLDATGGVGALVQITDHATSTSYFAAYDGNGNVAALLDTGGTTVAKYEYSPFGELLRCEGAYAQSNPFRFSTKFTDDESGLVYYGARYYSPSLGRFINRDPIEEQGGVNLYGFCANDAVNRWDVLGLDYVDPFTHSDDLDLNLTQQMALGLLSDGDFMQQSVSQPLPFFTQLARYAFDHVQFDYGWAQRQTPSGQGSGQTNASGGERKGKVIIGKPVVLEYQDPDTGKWLSWSEDSAPDKAPNSGLDPTYTSALLHALEGADNRVANNSRVPSRAPTVLELEAALMARVTAAGKGRANDPVAYARAQAELEAFRITNGLRPPGVPSDLTISTAGRNLRPAPNFIPPTNPPQLPPSSVPPGYTVRIMPPTLQYPDGYWRIEKPMPQGGAQGINPATMKPGPQQDTHVPLPPGWTPPN